MDEQTSGRVENKACQVVFYFFSAFALFFYSAAIFWGRASVGQNWSPSFLLGISRDIVFLAVLGIFYTCLFRLGFRKILVGSFGRFIKVWGFCVIGYLMIVAAHFHHRGGMDLFQHDIRNIILYSAFLPVLPVVFKDDSDFYYFGRLILGIVLGLSFLGILLRYSAFYYETWGGKIWGPRIIATLRDPNCFALVVSLAWILLLGFSDSFVRKRFLWWVSGMVLVITLIFTSSMGGAAVFFCSSLVILLAKNRFFKGSVQFCALFGAVIFFGLAIGIIENRFCSSEKYNIRKFSLADQNVVYKIDRVSGGHMRKGIEKKLTSDAFPSKGSGTLRSVDARLEQVESFDHSLKKKAGRGWNLSFLFGRFDSSKYIKTDSQYLNWFYNVGMVGAGMFIGIFFWALATAAMSWLAWRDGVSLVLGAYLFGILIFGFLTAAFLNRFPMNFLIYLILGLIFLRRDILTRAERAA